MSAGPAQNAELRAARRLDVVERRAVGLAYLARDIEPQSRAARRRGEERLEQLGTRLRRHAGAVVDHVQFYSTPSAHQRHADDDARRRAAAVTQRVAAQVPHHLVEMAAV